MKAEHRSFLAEQRKKEADERQGADSDAKEKVKFDNKKNKSTAMAVALAAGASTSAAAPGSAPPSGTAATDRRRLSS